MGRTGVGEPGDPVPRPLSRLYVTPDRVIGGLRALSCVLPMWVWTATNAPKISQRWGSKVGDAPPPLVPVRCLLRGGRVGPREPSHHPGCPSREHWPHHDPHRKRQSWVGVLSTEVRGGDKMGGAGFFFFEYNFSFKIEFSEDLVSRDRRRNHQMWALLLQTCLWKCFYFQQERAFSSRKTAFFSISEK